MQRPPAAAAGRREADIDRDRDSGCDREADRGRQQHTRIIGIIGRVADQQSG